MEGKLNFFLILIIALLSAAVAFIVIYLVMTGGVQKPEGDNHETAKTEKKVEIDYGKAVYFHVGGMEPVNLKSGGNNPKSIAKVDVVILIADQKFEEEFAKREAEVKDIIRTTFNSKTGDDLTDGKIEGVKEELLRSFREMFKHPKEKEKIVKVLFPSFFMQ